MKEWEHGGNIYEVAELIGCNPDEIIDLSASINPLGPPEGLKELLAENFQAIVHYPDIRNKALIGAIAKYHDIEEDFITVGNGSTELIYWLPRIIEWEKVAIVLPTFSEYLKALENTKGVRVRILTTSWEKGFQPTVYQLETLIEASQPEAIFITNPGSPSGVPVSKEVYDFIDYASKKYELFWVIDEVFVDFCESFSLLPLALNSSRVIILRSLTKFYSLPGLRLGYMVGNPSVVKKIRSLMPPWSVNVFSQLAGVFCLEADWFRERSLKFFKEERERVFGKLSKISSLEFLESHTNYILIKLKNIKSKELQERMIRNHKILVRDCSNFRGLHGSFIRVAILTEELNDRWIDALGKEL